jgi:mono/diheme cytochrome c family protein
MAAVSMGAAGCDEPLSDLGGPTPNLAPTFSSIQRDIFENGDSAGRVPCIQCHNPGGRLFTGGLDLTAASAYASLVGVASRDKPGAIRVVAGDPENSYLIHKLEGRAGIVGSRMPRVGPTLTDGQIQIIERWIALGARND